MYDEEKTIMPANTTEKEELIELLSNDICWLNAHINKMYQRMPANTIIDVKRDIRKYLMGIVEHLEDN